MHLISRRDFLRSIAISAGAVGLSGLSACAGQNSSANTTSRQLAEALSSNSQTKIETTPPIMSFVVMSDTHLSPDNDERIRHFTNALVDIRSLEPKPDTIVIVGDITENGFPEQYELTRTLCAQEGYDFDTDFIKVMGNHDQYSDDFDPEKTGWDEQYIRFMNEAGVSAVYYDVEVLQQHFICLGPDRNAGNWVRFNFSDEQMSWLEALLDEDEAAGQMSYVFCHEPLLNTVRNTGTGSWAEKACIVDEKRIRQSLQNRRNAVFFSGHTHLYPDIAQPDPNGPLYVNDGAVGPGQLSPTNMNYPEGFTGSFGWLVSVFANHLEFKARDFLLREWIKELDFIYAA